MNHGLTSDLNRIVFSNYLTDFCIGNLEIDKGFNPFAKTTKSTLCLVYLCFKELWFLFFQQMCSSSIHQPNRSPIYRTSAKKNISILSQCRLQCRLTICKCWAILKEKKENQFLCRCFCSISCKCCKLNTAICFFWFFTVYDGHMRRRGLYNRTW